MYIYIYMQVYIAHTICSRIYPVSPAAYFPFCCGQTWAIQLLPLCQGAIAGTHWCFRFLPPPVFFLGWGLHIQEACAPPCVGDMCISLCMCWTLQAWTANWQFKFARSNLPAYTYTCVNPQKKIHLSSSLQVAAAFSSALLEIVFS